MPKNPMDAPNSDLKVDERGYVAAEAVIKSKTTPNLRHEGTSDNSSTFEHDFTITVDDADAPLTDEFKDRQHVHVRQSAVQRGLVPSGPVKLLKTEKLDARNVRLVFSLPVEVNSADATYLPGVAVTEQPDDSPAGRPEDLAKQPDDSPAGRPEDLTEQPDDSPAGRPEDLAKQAAPAAKKDKVN